MVIRKLIFVAAVSALGALATACSNGSTAKSDENASSADSIAAEAVDVLTDEEAAAVVTLSDDNLIRPDKKLDKVTVLDFNATWCVPCKKFTPAFESVANRMGDKVDFYSVDIDDNPETRDAFGVESVPTIIVIKKDGTMDRYVGIGDLLPAEKFENIVKEAL